MGGEFEAIDRIRRLLPPAPAGVIGIGDDTAVVPTGVGMMLLAADTVVAGVHADLTLTGVDDLGWKALAVNISDIAAMGGVPGYALVGVAGPPDSDLDLLYEGIAAASRSFACPVVGGDLTNSPVLVVTVAVTGTLDGPPVLRSGALPDDVIWVTGPLGASAVGLTELRAGLGPGLAHRRPQPRLVEGTTARRAGATAMIDVSDGLAADLGHILDLSGLGCALDDVPRAPGATSEDALGGGEDYELVFTAPGGAGIEEAFRAAGLGPPVRIGRCTADPTRRTLRGEPLLVTGWEHTWNR